MKKFFFFVAIAGLSWGVMNAAAQSTFRASLVPVVPAPENYYIPASAAFSLDGPSVSFVISLGVELSAATAPTNAWLTGRTGEFTFDLSTPSIVVHSPLPWPPEPWQYDYSGSTAFYGSVLLPDNLREDLVAGRTALLLLGGTAGNFKGTVVPASRPLIKGLDRQGSSLGVHFNAEPPFLYRVQYTDSAGATNWSDLGKVGASSRTFEAVVIDSASQAGARFYRIRREIGDLKLEGIVGQVFLVGYCPNIRPEFDCSPRPFQSTVGVVSAAGELITQFSTAADGRFHFCLSPGDYTLVALGAQSPFTPPVKTTVERGKLTTVILIFNAGIY